MIERRFVLWATMAGIAAIAIAPASAFEKTAFDAKAFEAAQAGGKAILVEVSAPWCPTCKAQKPILSGLAAKAKFKDLVVFEIDFDEGSSSQVRCVHAEHTDLLQGIERGRPVDGRHECLVD